MAVQEMDLKQAVSNRSINYSCSCHSGLEQRIKRNEDDIKQNKKGLDKLTWWIVISSSSLIGQLVLMILLFSLKLKS